MTPPEIDPTTGEIKAEDYHLAVAVGGVVPHGRSFTPLSLAQQAEIQAKIKAIFDFNVEPECPYVWATDVRGRVGTFPTQKTRNPRRQREMLERIARAGVIEGAVGVAAGEIKTLRESERESLVPRRQRLND